MINSSNRANKNINLVALTSKEKSDIKTLMQFVEIYCRENHSTEKTSFTISKMNLKTIRKKSLLLCPECTKLLRYGLTMRLRCPHNPKPMCKKCITQCYKGEYRLKIREIMKFSGIYLVKHGRLDLLFHYLK